MLAVNTVYTPRGPIYTCEEHTKLINGCVKFLLGEEAKIEPLKKEIECSHCTVLRRYLGEPMKINYYK